MEKRILAQLINIDKVAYKEINFKSKLIEWCQKNKVLLDFKLIEQKKEGKNSPVFKYQVLVEGLEGGVGEGYSKKESQQIASKLTLQQLKRKPQFIDAVFAAKGDRTKMEEEPVLNVPDTEQKTDFIISQTQEEPVEVYTDTAVAKGRTTAAVEKEDEFDFSDIKATPKKISSEDIIAASMSEAYKD